MTAPLTPVEIAWLKERGVAASEVSLRLLATVDQMTRRLEAAEKVIETMRKLADVEFFADGTVRSGLRLAITCYDSARKETSCPAP